MGFWEGGLGGGSAFSRRSLSPPPCTPLVVNLIYKTSLKMYYNMYYNITHKIHNTTIKGKLIYKMSLKHYKKLFNIIHFTANIELTEVSELLTSLY